jgi:hemoglobin-like flavoprotein
LDVQRLQESFARMAMHGDAVPLFFYSDLFLRHPETRDLFPVSMAAQRDRLVHALGRIVSDVSRADALGGYLRDLGREHRKFGAIAEYYPHVGASLLATLAHFNGPAWTPELATDWKAAHDLVAQVMMEAAAEDAAARPAFWEATVIAHEHKGPPSVNS